MSGTYIELLDATIQYLQDLKAEGQHWVSLRPESLAQFTAPIPSRPRVAARPPSAAIAPPPAERATANSLVPPIPQVPPPRADPVVAASPKSTDGSLAQSTPAGSKAELMAELHARVRPCTQCAHLAKSRKSVVFGVGDVNSPVMFVGEAPGADEDVQGEPFVGAAGQLLTRIIKTMGFTRESAYIANVLKCRPDTPGQTSGNRKPTPEEMKTCLPYLLEQIRIIQPKVIVALGATAMEGLFGRPIPITKARGNWLTFDGIPVMPTFHPSYLLRNQAPAVKRQVWEDMLQVLEKLGLPVTEKQRNYFKT